MLSSGFPVSLARLEQAPRTDWRGLAGRFALVFVPLMLVGGGVVGALYRNQAETELTVLKLNERRHVELQAETIVGDFQSIVADLRFLTTGRALRALLEADTPEKRRDLASDLAETYQAFLHHKPLYDQLRFIDATGMEVVRVNMHDSEAVIVPQKQLQNKRDRYYFKDTIKLHRNQVFVSPFDLNVEETHIEWPPKPTIRFGTPVFDASGRRQGIVVLNYLGAKLLDKLRRHALGAVGQPLLLNQEGYYLAGPSREKEWGFMPDLPERKEFTLAREAPEVWRQITASASDQIESRGVYTFRTVYPLRGLTDASFSIPDINAYYWKVISHIGAAPLKEMSQRFWSGLWRAWFGLGLLFAAAAFLVAWFSVQNKWARQRLLQRERLAAIGEAMTALAHESRNALQRSECGLEMLREYVEGHAEASGLLAEVHEAQQYLTSLYEEVRGYAAPVNLRRETTDLAELLRRTWRHLEGEPNSAHAQLLVEDGKLDTRCDVDPRAIGQVFRNVLENALGAADPAEIRVAWSEASLHGRPALRTTIHDNGPGLPREERERIFEPFYTTKLRGTGLGLAISRRLVEAHGGSIYVDEELERGTKIVIDLPRKSGADVQPVCPAASEARRNACPPARTP